MTFRMVGLAGMQHIPGATHSYINCRLEVPGREACPLVRAMDGRGGLWLPACQVHGILQPYLKAACSLAAFERLFPGQTNKRNLTGPDRSQLVSLGAAQSRCTQVSMLKLHAVVKALKGRLVPQGKPLLHSLQRLRDLHAVIPWEGPATEQWQVPEPLPRNLPSSTTISPRRFKAVSLTKKAPHLLHAQPLCNQLASFQTWLTNQIQLDRDGHALASATWKNVQTHVLHFLGFAHTHCAVPMPNLLDFLQPDLHATFLRHGIEKATKHHYSRHHLYISSKVIGWLRSQPKGQHPSLPKLLTWLQRAASQIKHSGPVPRKNVQEMTAAGTWISAGQLLHAIMQGKQLAESSASRPPITSYVARDIHDAALSCCIFGYLPPPRLTCLRTCTIPSYTGRCLHPDCKDPSSCHGNQLLAAPDAAAGGSMRFYFPHHKTSIGRQHARPITFALPAELAALLQLYLREGRPRLVSQNHPYLFLSKTGQHLASKSGSSKLVDIWHSWMGRLGCRQVAPSTCRHIFVVDRRSQPSMPGPVDEHAAVVMGNSTQQWDHGIYDVSQFETAAQHAVDGMSAWRSAHQQQFAAAACTSPVPHGQQQSAETDDSDIYLSMSDAEEDV